MENWDSVVKQARECHTKLAWEDLFSRIGDAVATTNTSKPLQELFRLLSTDAQSLQYDPSIWGQLIRGCLSSWNLELGSAIADFSQKLPSAETTIPATQLYLEAGLLSKARSTATRALRLSTLSPAAKLQLEMLVLSTFAEEGKQAKALKLLGKIDDSIRKQELSTKERADFLTHMGRMQFLLGRYHAAGESFYEASGLYRELADWEGAAKTIFNTAACYENSGDGEEEKAFAFVEECRRIAESHNLFGPLAHCEAFYGLNSYNHGDFAAAREQFRRALEYLPLSDKSYRRLHILSMLSYTYLAMGRYHLAKKFGHQTLDLASLDESSRFETRYITLHAELLWEDGDIEGSQRILSSATGPYEQRGLHTLEEIAMLSRYNMQSALLGQKVISNKFKIDDNLTRHAFTWLDRSFSLGLLHLNRGEDTEALRLFSECQAIAVDEGNRYHEALGLLGQLQLYLKRKQPKEAEPLCRTFEVAVARLGETPLRTQTLIIRSAIAYQQGDFEECERTLKLAAKSTRQSFPERFVLGCCLATIEGRSSRLTSGWQLEMMGRFTRTYFAPSLRAVDKRNFLVSDHYLISLERHPSLAELLHFLLLKSNYSATNAEVQTGVWQQSLNSQGWQQKIRNTIMRLRDFFPQTIAPLIVHNDSIQLFKEAISIDPSRRDGLGTADEVLRLLADSPMSSNQLSKRLKVSPATVKRILKRLGEEDEIRIVREGRNVYYLAETSGSSSLNT